MKRIVVILIIALALWGCRKPVPPFDETPSGVVSIAHLKSLARGESYTITDDISIEGYVIANDLFGEYYKSIVISDESGGVEIAVDVAKTATQFPISARVVVYCSGLTLGDYGGSLTLGAIPEGEYSVDRISSKDILRYFLVDKTTPKAIEPVRLNINEIKEEHIGNYIRLDNVTFVEQAKLAWCDKEPVSGEYIATERTLQDREGNKLAVRTIAECHYRAEKIPSGYGTVCGVVEYFNGKYSLRIVNHMIEFK